MKLLKWLLIPGIVILVIAGGSAFLPAAMQWYQELAYPATVKPPLQSRSWSIPAGTVPREPQEAPLSRSEAAEILENPRPATPDSIERGKNLFLTYCEMCHGPEGKGDGPVAGRSRLRIPDLAFMMRARNDGHLYGTIRNGGMIMPPYGYRIAPAERWDLVNYLRSLQ